MAEIRYAVPVPPEIAFSFFLDAAARGPVFGWRRLGERRSDGEDDSMHGASEETICPVGEQVAYVEEDWGQFRDTFFATDWRGGDLGNVALWYDGDGGPFV